jgi:hypothetical protein
LGCCATPWTPRTTTIAAIANPLFLVVVIIATPVSLLLNCLRPQQVQAKSQSEGIENERVIVRIAAGIRVTTHTLCLQRHKQLTTPSNSAGFDLVGNSCGSVGAAKAFCGGYSKCFRVHLRPPLPAGNGFTIALI